MLQDEVDLQRTSLTPLEERDFADHFAASSAQPASITAWAQLQQNSRRILSLDIGWAWSEAFDKAYLGEVEEANCCRFRWDCSPWPLETPPGGPSGNQGTAPRRVSRWLPGRPLL